MNRQQRILRAAGYVDGEGCVLIVKQRGATSARGWYFTLRLQVGTNCKLWLDELQDLFGGKVNFRPNKYGGSYEWKISTNMAATALREMLPYMIEKAPQVKVALKFADRRRFIVENGTSGRFTPLTDKQVKMDERDYNTLKELKRQRY